MIENPDRSTDGWNTTALRDERSVCWRRRGSGPPVVFCHGTPWSSVVWDAVARSLSHRWTTYVWDMPGFGRSDMSAGQDVSLAAQGAVFAELVEAWGLDEVTVVAHDVGGAVALAAHLCHGRRFRRLVLVDVVTLRPWGSPFFRLVAEHHEVFAALPAALHEGLVRAYIAGASSRGLDGPTADALVRPWLSRTGQAAFYAQIAQADPRDTDVLVAGLAHVDVPTTIVWGEDDTWIPVEQAHRLAAAIPGADLHVVPAAGHLAPLDAPDAVLEHLTAALNR